MNEKNLELLEFVVSGQSFGIGVVQVREILPYYPVTPVPNAHPSVEGIFMPRGSAITAIDLKKSLNLGEAEPNGSFIVTQHEDTEIAFHVDGIIGIHRVEDGMLIPIEETGVLDKDGYVKSILKIREKLIVVLNFLKIIAEVNPDIVNENALAE